MGKMTGSEMRDCLSILRWTQRHLAEILTADERLVRKWAADKVEIPDNIADWLRLLAGALRSLPKQPEGWIIRD